MNDQPDPNRVRILFVCTANRCRSAMAEALARRRFDGVGIDVDSAGLLDAGDPMPPNGVAVARELGLDLSAHRSRRVDRTGLGSWDAILTMSRAQSRELVALDDAIWPRVFTLPQFARWISGRTPGRRMRLGRWIDLAASDRSRTELVGADPADDVADPVEGPVAEWRRLVERLESDLDAVAARLT